VDIKRLDEKLDKIMEEIIDIKISVARNTGSLEEHMRRTEVAEENLRLLREEVEPIKAHVSNVHNVGNVFYTIVKVAAASATVAGVLRAFKLL
jgi:archaellum component FlaC